MLHGNHTKQNTLQHIATHCNTLQHTATHCNAQQHTATHGNTSQHSADGSSVSHKVTLKKTHCNTLQHTAAHCNTLQHTATHCNTLQLFFGHVSEYFFKIDPLSVSRIKIATHIEVSMNWGNKIFHVTKIIHVLCCNSFECVAVHCSVLQRGVTPFSQKYFL